MPSKTMTPITMPMIRPACDPDEDVGDVAAADAPDDAPGLAPAEAFDPAASSGFDVSLGAEACSAFSGEMIP